MRFQETKMNGYIRQVSEIKHKKLMKLKKQQRQRTNSFSVVRIVKDSNCFYRCLSQNLHGTQMRHRVIRDKVVQHMSLNKQKYAPLIDGDIEMHLRLQRFSDGRISSWATEAEIQAAADTYQVNILVATDESFRTWNTFQGDHDLETDTIDANIYLLCKNSHFSLVKKAKNNPGNDDLSLHSIPDWFEPEETELTYPKCVDTHENMPTKATHSSFHKIKTYKANTDKKIIILEVEILSAMLTGNMVARMNIHIKNQDVPLLIFQNIN